MPRRDRAGDGARHDAATTAAAASGAGRGVPARLADRVFRVRELGIVARARAADRRAPRSVKPRFLSEQSSRDLLLNAAILALLAVGQTLVVITRNVDLSVGSVLGLSAFVDRRPAARAPGHGASRWCVLLGDRAGRRLRPGQRPAGRLRPGARRWS